MRNIACAITLFLVLASSAAASILFTENFESPLPGSNWQYALFGYAVVTDPLDASNKALHFNDNASGGDLFSVLIPYHPLVLLTFDFMRTNSTAVEYIGTDHWVYHLNGGSSNEQWL